jgi:outer membrane biogenesis lipoprotein LolB
LPLADLSHYVLGNTPSGASDANVKRNADQQLASVSHNGWEIEFTPNEQPGQGARPMRLRMRKDAVEVRIVIDQLDANIS